VQNVSGEGGCGTARSGRGASDARTQKKVENASFILSAKKGDPRQNFAADLGRVVQGGFPDDLERREPSLETEIARA
jgi:hypothetical protein